MKAIFYILPLLLFSTLTVAKTTLTNPLIKDNLSDKDSLLAYRNKQIITKTQFTKIATSPTKEVKIVKKDNPTIIRKGEALRIPMEDEAQFYQVRVHTSLGRLMKKYTDIRGVLTINTQFWEAGIYTVVISTDSTREIRKVLITE